MPSPKLRSSSSRKKSPTKKLSSRSLQRDEPIDELVQTTPSYVCYSCMNVFSDGAALQAHVLLTDHSGDVHKCRECQSALVPKLNEFHNCIKNKANFLRVLSSATLIKHGLPYQCLFCRAQHMESRVELVLHLICRHKPQRVQGRCGMCAFQFSEPNDQLPSGLALVPTNASNEAQWCQEKERKHFDDLRIHVMREHLPQYQIFASNSEIQSLNCPYVCPICQYSLKSNVALHAHVLCCHGNMDSVSADFNVCAECGYIAKSRQGLNDHVLAQHTAFLKYLAELWTKNMLIMNVANLSNVCSCCWTVFNHDFELQTHLIASHTHPWYKCGLCHLNVSAYPNQPTAFMMVQLHELNHARAFHQIAFDNQWTMSPLGDVLPECTDIELMIRAKLQNGVKTAAAGKESMTKKKDRKMSKKLSKGSKSPTDSKSPKLKK